MKNSTTTKRKVETFVLKVSDFKGLELFPNNVSDNNLEKLSIFENINVGDLSLEPLEIEFKPKYNPNYVPKIKFDYVLEINTKEFDSFLNNDLTLNFEPKIIKKSNNKKDKYSNNIFKINNKTYKNVPLF